MIPCPSFPKCDCAEKCKEGHHGFNVECLRADLWMLNSQPKEKIVDLLPSKYIDKEQL